MRFFRPAYLLFAFFAVLVCVFDPGFLRGSPRPGYEEVAKFGIIFTLTVCAGYFAYRSFIRDFKFARGKIALKKDLELRISSSEEITLTPISGDGPCQVRLRLKRMGTDASSDSFEISRLDRGGRATETEILTFAFDRESCEFDVPDSGTWSLGVKIRPTGVLNEPFIGTMHLEVFGRCKNVSVPNRFERVE